MSQLFEDASQVCKRLPGEFMRIMKKPDGKIDELARVSCITSAFMLVASIAALAAKPAAVVLAKELKAHGYFSDRHPELEKRQQEQRQAPAPQ